MCVFQLYRKAFVSERSLQSSTTTGSSSNPSHSSYPNERDIWSIDGILIYHRIHKRMANNIDRADTCRAETPRLLGDND
ncbi:hypothetical protein MTO96_009433 [Rhipicephalus appendiculatus]